MKILSNNTYLLLIDEEAEIKELDLIFVNNSILKIIDINRSENYAFLRSYDYNGEINGQGDMPLDNCKKIIAYYPLTKEAKELDLPLLPLVGLETEEGKIWKEDGIFVYLQNGKKYKKSELELWVENI